MLEIAVKVLLAYSLGSILGSLVIGSLRGVDIRTLGSGNAGGTNALRTQGLLFAVGVMLIDIGKGWLAARVVPVFSLPGVESTGLAEIWLAIACSAAVVVGHVYPVWFGFRGGKGAATLVGVLAGLYPGALLPVLSAWVLVLIFTGYVGLATVAATAFFPVYLWIANPPAAIPLLVFGVLMAVFILFTHRSNIARMRAGTENRAQRVWLLRPR